MKEDICIYFKIPCDKVDVLINPVDKDIINKLVNNGKNPFDNNYINLVSVGRLAYQKGFDILIKAFSKVIKEDKNYKLHIIGDGKDRKKLENLIKKLNLEDYIFLLGFQKNPYIYMNMQML